MQGCYFVPSARTGQLVDYCSHFKLSEFVMVKHRHAGSWLGKPVVLVWLRTSTLGHCHLGAQRLFPSGSGKRAPDRESSGNPVASLGRCWCNRAGSQTSSLVLLQPWLAPLPTGQFFWESHRGDRPPACLKVWAFSFYDLFILFFEGFGLFTFPSIFSLPKRV